jgi:hypothetical protein
MMSVDTIAYMSNQVAKKAASHGLVPYQPADAGEPLRWGKHVPIPNIGSYRPSGWQLMEDHMVDAMGGDDAGGSAMTLSAFKSWVQDTVVKDPTAGFAIIEEGEFQVVVGYFTQNEKLPFDDGSCEDDDDGPDERMEEWTCPKCGKESTDSLDSEPFCTTCREFFTWDELLDERNYL